jgi:hypothetical protein
LNDDRLTAAELALRGGNQTVAELLDGGEIPKREENIAKNVEQRIEEDTPRSTGKK